MSDRKPFRIVHYLNQFYAGKGGEAFASVAPFKIDGSVGPGRLLEHTSQGKLQVVGTVVCGDNYFVEESGAADEVFELIKSYQPDGFIAGPAFLAGRYGEACTEICSKVKEKLNIPVITGLAPEHPSVDRYRKELPIFRTGTSGADMKNSMPRMGEIIFKLLHGTELSSDEQDLLYKRGLKKNVVLEKTAAQRAVEILLAKFRGESWQSELPMPQNDTVAPAAAVKEKPFTLALITDGGLILKGNPERMPSGRSDRYCKINIDSWEKLTPEKVEVNHFGYDNRYVLADPNRLVPLDVVRELEKQGEIRLHQTIYSTAGAATAIENAASFGCQIADELKKAGVQAAILTST
jgi:betaine reductase